MTSEEFDILKSEAIERIVKKIDSRISMIKALDLLRYETCILLG